jgi:hypothetical protein
VPARARSDAVNHSGRIVLSAAIGFAAGVAAAGEGGVFAAIGGFGIARAVWPSTPARDRTSSGPRRLLSIAALHASLLLALALLCGCACASLHARRNPTSALVDAWRRAGFEEGATPIRLHGRVSDVERLDDDRVALVVRLERWSIPAGGADERRATPPVGARLTLPWPAGRAIPWNEGDRITTVARLGQPRRFRNPGSFDYPGPSRPAASGSPGA